MYNQFPLAGMTFVDIIMELCDGTLDDFMKNPSQFNAEMTNEVIMLASASGLDYLHNKKIIHKDLKGVKHSLKTF